MAKIHVTLTVDEINEGFASEPDSCPVALALEKAVSNGFWEVTSEFLVWHRTDTDVTRWTTPDRVAKWINNFDKNNGVDNRSNFMKWLLGPKFKPLKFTLEENDKPVYAKNNQVFYAEILLAKARREQSQ